MKEVEKFLDECGTYFLATVDSSNKPKVRPFGTINVYNEHLYIQTGKNKDVFKQIENNSDVEISAFSNGKWIRLSGKLVLDDSVDAKKSMLDKYPNLRGMYDENDDNTAVLYFESAKAVIYSFTDSPKEIYSL